MVQIDLKEDDFIMLYLLTRDEMNRAEVKAIEALKKYGENSPKYLIADGYFGTISELLGIFKKHLPKDYMQ